MKRAGYDHIIIEGKSQEPVYLWIDNDRVEIKKAGHLWGKNIREAEAQIKKERNDKRVRVATIGQAGERLVRIANIVHEERSASRTGLGAVMGSKHLKAVAIRGTEKVKLFDPDGFARLAKEMQQRIAKSDKYDHFRKNGGSTGTYGTSKAGFLASKNFGQTGDFEGIENFNPRNVAPRFYLSNKPCFKCPIGCGKRWEVKDGPFAGEWGNKIEEGAFTPLGPVCGNSNVESVFKMNNMANQLGLDTIECAAGMAVVMEWYEKGIVSKKDLDGIELTWGNYEAMIQMMEKIAFRQGVGDILAEGIVKASRTFGKEAEKCVSHSKGMGMSGVDSRLMKGTSLGFATSTRGACHLTALVPVEFPAFPVMTKEQAEATFGTAEVMDPASYKKASALIYYQHRSLMCDLFQVCKFLLGLGTGTKDFSYDNLYSLFYLATGVKSDEKGVLTVAERVHNVERAYSCREGLDRKDDHLVGKWADEPVPNGPHKGEMLDPAKWEQMLDEYYDLRGWTRNGVPGKEKLTALGLEDVARALEEAKVY
jgi:aldehyde:ferredoxin oxidoreductase